MYMCVCAHSYAYACVRKHVARNCYLERMVVSAGSKECSVCLSPDCAVQEIAG